MNEIADAFCCLKNNNDKKIEHTAVPLGQRDLGGGVHRSANV